MAEPKTARKRTRVLVATGESPVRETIIGWLAAANFEPEGADTASAALELQQQVVFDIVIADLEISDRAGLDLSQQIKREFPKTAVLMLTSQADVRLAVQALIDGALGYLVKPVQQTELLCHLERSLERDRLLADQGQRAWRLQRRIDEQTRIVRQAHEETVQRLLKVCLLQKGETIGHIKRVGMSSALVAQSLGWSKELVELIQLAAQMHDVGQIGIPDGILQKPGRLTQKERAVMQCHANLGARMLSGSLSPVLQMAEQIAHYHHEHWDGTGYPARLSAQRIPTAARIVALVDVYDALTHDRAFRPAFSEDEVLEMINDGIGSHFDPTVAYAFFDALPAIQAVSLVSDTEGFSISNELPTGIRRELRA
ncbi:MAG: HD domain-containing phosphohydrolase [Planctomycetota bacterium]